MPDDLDQVAEASDGEVGQHTALEYRPDPLQRVEIRGAGGRLVHPQPGWALAAGRDWRESVAGRCDRRFAIEPAVPPD